MLPNLKGFLRKFALKIFNMPQFVLAVQVPTMECKIVSASIDWSICKINLECILTLQWDLLSILILQFCQFLMFVFIWKSMWKIAKCNCQLIICTIIKTIWEFAHQKKYMINIWIWNYSSILLWLTLCHMFWTFGIIFTALIHSTNIYVSHCAGY